MRRIALQALDGVAGGLRHQGVIARYEAPRQVEESALPGLIEAAGGKALILVLDGVQDPHNLGACLRSAAAAAVTAVIIPKDKAAPINATVRKTSPVLLIGCRDQRDQPGAHAAHQGSRRLGLWLEASAGGHPPVDFRGNIALVLGGEGDGHAPAHARALRCRW